MKNFLLGLFLMGTSVVHAEVLSWCVDIPSGNSYATAQLFATATVNPNYWDEAGTIQSDKFAPIDSAGGVLRKDSVLTVDTSYRFFVKLFNASDVMIGYSELIDYATLSSSGVIWSGAGIDAPYSSVWNAVPEPTSVGLLALGMSALLLRRRRRV